MKLNRAVLWVAMRLDVRIIQQAAEPFDRVPAAPFFAPPLERRAARDRLALFRREPLRALRATLRPAFLSAGPTDTGEVPRNGLAHFRHSAASYAKTLNG